MIDQDNTTMMPEVRDAPYRFDGIFYEACDCFSVCPCWTGNNPDEGECTGVFAWAVEAGSNRWRRRRGAVRGERVASFRAAGEGAPERDDLRR